MTTILTRYFVPTLVAGMLITGTLNTLLNKFQDFVCVSNCDDPNPEKRHAFEQPVWQTLMMFIGEAGCLLVYLTSLLWESHHKYLPLQASAPPGTADAEQSPGSSPPVHSAQNDDDDDDDDDGNVDLAAASEREPLSGWRNFLFLIPTVCDLTATTLMGVGLLSVSASVYQMLRGSVVIFTGIFSAIFLGHRHAPHKWFALFTIFVGVSIVGLSGALQTSAAPGQSSNIRGSAGGIALVVLAQTFTATQFVVEEKIMTRYEVPAMKAVGLEGIFGLLCFAVGLPTLHYTIGVRGPPGNFFDMYAGFDQVTGNVPILLASIGIIFSIAGFNWCGISVTRNLSSTARSTIDTCRTLFIWILNLC
eukprot:jgi/Hompol1/5900/HPOL_000336-RA